MYIMEVVDVYGMRINVCICMELWVEAECLRKKKGERNNDCCSEMNVCWELNASVK